MYVTNVGKLKLGLASLKTCFTMALLRSVYIP